MDFKRLEQEGLTNITKRKEKFQSELKEYLEREESIKQAQFYTSDLEDAIKKREDSMLPLKDTIKKQKAELLEKSKYIKLIKDISESHKNQQKLANHIKKGEDLVAKHSVNADTINLTVLLAKLKEFSKEFSELVEASKKPIEDQEFSEPVEASKTPIEDQEFSEPVEASKTPIEDQEFSEPVEASKTPIEDQEFSEPVEASKTPIEKQIDQCGHDTAFFMKYMLKSSIKDIKSNLDVENSSNFNGDQQDRSNINPEKIKNLSYRVNNLRILLNNIFYKSTDLKIANEDSLKEIANEDSLEAINRIYSLATILDITLTYFKSLYYVDKNSKIKIKDISHSHLKRDEHLKINIKDISHSHLKLDEHLIKQIAREIHIDTILKRIKSVEESTAEEVEMIEKYDEKFLKYFNLLINNLNKAVQVNEDNLTSFNREADDIIYCIKDNINDLSASKPNNLIAVLENIVEFQNLLKEAEDIETIQKKEEEIKNLQKKITERETYYYQLSKLSTDIHQTLKQLKDEMNKKILPETIQSISDVVSDFNRRLDSSDFKYIDDFSLAKEDKENISTYLDKIYELLAEKIDYSREILAEMEESASNNIMLEILTNKKHGLPEIGNKIAEFKAFLSKKDNSKVYRARIEHLIVNKIEAKKREKCDTDDTDYKEISGFIIDRLKTLYNLAKLNYRRDDIELYEAKKTIEELKLIDTSHKLIYNTILKNLDLLDTPADYVKRPGKESELAQSCKKIKSLSKSLNILLSNVNSISLDDVKEDLTKKTITLREEDKILALETNQAIEKQARSALAI